MPAIRNRARGSLIRPKFTRYDDLPDASDTEINEPPQMYEPVLRSGLLEGGPYHRHYKHTMPKKEPTKPPGLEKIMDPRPPPLKLKDFECIRTLGSGTFGKVVLVRTIRESHALDKPGSLFAMKLMKKKHIRHADKSEPTLKDIERINLANVPWSPWVNGIVRTFHDRKNLYLMLEYIPSLTLSGIIKQEPVKPTTSAFYYANIVCALEFLQRFGVVHRDLKPDNIIIASDGYLCLADFGTSILSYSNHTPLDWMMVGSPAYMAPELSCQTSAEFGHSVDWWASGCILYEMLTQKTPFHSESDQRLFEKAQSAQYTWPRSMKLGKRLKAIVSEFLTVDVDSRLGTKGVDEVKKHPWFETIDWEKMKRKQYLAPAVPQLRLGSQWHNKPLLRQKECPGLKVVHPPLECEFDERFPQH